MGFERRVVIFGTHTRKDLIQINVGVQGVLISTIQAIMEEWVFSLERIRVGDPSGAQIG